MLVLEGERLEGVVSKITALEDRVINLENKFDDLNEENKLEREEYRKELVSIKDDIIDIRNKIDRELGELIDSNVYQRNVLDRLMNNVLEGNKLAEEREENARKRTEEIKRESRNQWFKMLSSGGILFIIIQAIIQALTN